MHKDWLEIANTLNGATKQVREGIPGVMKAFGDLAKVATADGALDPKTKELLAMAISVAIRCDGCIAFHAKAALRHGATREELLETVGMAIYMGGGPSLMYGAQALEAYDQWAADAAAKAPAAE